MRIAVYAGTFDPITRGHPSVIERGRRLFDRLVVVIAVNPAKQPLFSIEERAQMIRETTSRWPNVDSASTDGYVVDFARQREAKYLIRGVRSCTDVESEITLAQMNRELAPEVSSSRLKELSILGMDISRYCPLEVAVRLLERVNAGAVLKLEAAHV